MVVTAHMLHHDMGVDAEIADYFANRRPVPQQNLFWKGKHIYLSAGFGTLTIPLVYDLQFKMGLDKTALLNDAHVDLMEAGFDLLSRYENGLMDLPAFLNACKLLLADKVKQQHLVQDLFSFFSNKTPAYFAFYRDHASLARSDMFLFTLADLDVSDEWVAAFLPYWYAVARPILIMDDFVDLEEDRLTGEKENIIIELGNNREAIYRAFEMGMKDLDRLATVNEKLAKHIQLRLEYCMNKKYIRSQLHD